MSGYIGTTPAPQASQTRDVYTATAGQTSFATSGYTPSFLDVYVNGSHLKNGTDYTASNGSDVVMASGLTAGDYVEVVAFTTFSTSDTVSAASGGTFSGNVIVDGSNKLGVGTSNPIADFSLVDSSTGSGMEFQPELTTDTNRLTNYDRGDSAYKKFRLDASEQQFYISGSERMRINGDGVITAPSQPAFQVTKSGHQSNIAVGTATVTFDTEIFDQGSNFSSNTFTAPVTGRYQLSLMLYLDNLDSAANYYQAWIATSNRGYYSIFDPDYGQDNGYMFINASILADMDANDTAYVSIEMGANGNAQTDINATTKFSGFLVA